MSFNHELANPLFRNVSINIGRLERKQALINQSNARMYFVYLSTVYLSFNENAILFIVYT